MYDGCDREWIPPLMLVNTLLDKMSSLNSCHVWLRPSFSLPVNPKLHIISVAYTWLLIYVMIELYLDNKLYLWNLMSYESRASFLPVPDWMKIPGLSFHSASSAEYWPCCVSHHHSSLFYLWLLSIHFAQPFSDLMWDFWINFTFLHIDSIFLKHTC